jgi:hypothetical protein
MTVSRRTLLAGSAGVAAAGAALTVLVIRHGEKPGEGWPGPGLTAEGAADRKSLAVRGWQRAGSWAVLFGAGLGGRDYPSPAAIYALNPDSGEDSRRPFETIVPLAARLALKPVSRYALGQEAALVDELLRHSGVVLICWEHYKIASAILPGLAGGQHLPGLPSRWDDARYDVVLRFDRRAPGAPWTFRQLFPRLLSGDSDQPMT